MDLRFCSALHLSDGDASTFMATYLSSHRFIVRPGLGDWLFGCGVRQEVCPWNRKVPLSAESVQQAQPELEQIAVELCILLDAP